MVNRKGRARPKRPRRKSSNMQSSLQRIKSGIVRRSRLPPDPPSRNLYGVKSGTIEFRCSKAASAAWNYGTAVNVATLGAAAFPIGITTVDLKSLIAAQLIGLKTGDLVAGSLQYSINSASLWAGPDIDSVRLAYIYNTNLIPVAVVTDSAAKNQKARVKLAMPRQVWLKDNETSATMFSVNLTASETTAVVQELFTMRISVSYVANDVLSA